MPSREDPLDWWRLNHQRFPALAMAARDHLAARSTSAPSEGVFSTGRQIVSEFRRQLSAESIKKCVLLRSWMKLLKMA